MRPTTPPDDPAELLLYKQYNLAMGSALFGLFGEGFMLCACLIMWGYWNVKHVRREPWGIQLLAHYQLIACLGSAAHWFYLFLDLFVYSPDPLHTLAQGELVRALYIVELYLTIPIEVFYVYRCWQVWGKKLWVLISFLLPVRVQVATMSGGIYLLSLSGLNYFNILSGPWFWIAMVILTVAEWSISVTLYLGLRRIRDQTTFHSTRHLVEKVIVAVGVILKTAIIPHVAISAVYGCLLKFETITFFVVLIAKQVIRDDALQQQEQSLIHLDVVEESIEPDERGLSRSPVNALACSLPFVGRNTKKRRNAQLEAGLGVSQTMSLPTLSTKGEMEASVPDGSAGESKDSVVSDFAVHITGVPRTTWSSSTTIDLK